MRKLASILSIAILIGLPAGRLWADPQQQTVDEIEQHCRAAPNWTKAQMTACWKWTKALFRNFPAAGTGALIDQTTEHIQTFDPGGSDFNTNSGNRNSVGSSNSSTNDSNSGNTSGDPFANQPASQDPFSNQPSSQDPFSNDGP